MAISTSITDANAFFAHILATNASLPPLPPFPLIAHQCPSALPALKFSNMWADFEWENKVAVNTNVPTLRAFVQHVACITHMQVLTPMSGVEGAATFLAANLYARSTFGEDAIMNVSVEQRPDGSIKGHIRIRAKTQGVALSLGDRITAQQKVDTPHKAHE